MPVIDGEFLPQAFMERPYARQRFLGIVRYARKHHPWYQDRLTVSDHVPILTRQEILDNNDALLNGHAANIHTSGSTGIPVRLAHGARRAKLSRDDQELLIRWLGGRVKASQIIHPRSKKHRDGLIPISLPVDQQLEQLKLHQQAGYVGLTTYPTNAEMLAQAILARGIDMQYIQRVGLFSEALEHAQEALIKKAFPNAGIWSSYSAMEVGMIAARCPHEPDYHHLMAHKLGIEVLDDAGQVCPPGVLGRVVITDYFNQITPLIRYEIGDLAAMGHCPCGKIKLPALSRIAGKVRGALKHRDGQRIMFVDMSVALRDLPGMRQYQVIQHELERFTVRAVCAEPLDAEIRNVFETHFGYRPKQLTIQYTDAIERGSNGKFYASICEC